MKYKVLPLERRTIAVEDYIKSYRNVEYFEKLCRACPNYGINAGCPPFDSEPDLLQWNKIELWLMKIEIDPEAEDGVDDLRDVVMKVRPEWEELLLEEEEVRGGRAALFAGLRGAGEPVRPSLEALGFDLERTSSELFGHQMQWAADGKLPEYLTLIGGLFYQ